MSVAALDGGCNNREGMMLEMERRPLHARRGIACAAVSIFESPEERRGEEECSPSASSSTSSIGKNSDLSFDDEHCEEEENEAQSAYKGTLDSMEALEEVLPIRRGISKFYAGKSKSFTSLAEASSTPSMKDLVKPENAYSRKRRNLLAFSNGWEKSRGLPYYRGNGGGIAKRPITSSRSTLALAVAMSSSDSICSTSDDSISSSNSKSPPHLPPLHPRSKASYNNLASLSSYPQLQFSPWRSLSLADLQHCTTNATANLYCDKLDH